MRVANENGLLGKVTGPPRAEGGEGRRSVFPEPPWIRDLVVLCLLLVLPSTGPPSPFHLAQHGLSSFRKLTLALVSLL